jgi:hypothetical protein
MTPILNTFLLVTWLGAGAASSYQVEFLTFHRCEEARDTLLKDAQRIGDKVTLSAVCVAK